MFSKFFIYRPVFALVVSIVIVIVGTICIPLLPVEQTPDITPPTVSVRALYPGASAQVIAETVAAPIEEQVNGVENMIYMSSKSSDDGTMDLTVTFEVGTDIDMATVLVQNRVAIAEPLLPEEVKRRGVTTKKKSTSIVLMVSLVSPDGRFDEVYLSNYALTRVKDVLGRVPGVSDVVLFGAKDFSMRIWLDPDLLRARNLTTQDVVDAIREQNVQVAAGKIGQPPSPPGQNFEYTVNTLGRLSDPEQFENIVIKVGEGGELLRVKDVARVELGAFSYSQTVKLDGKPNIALGIYQLPGSNALAVREGVGEAMKRLAEQFPEGMEYRVPYDTTEFIGASIKEVIINLFAAVILVIFTVWIFLQDFRTSLIPAVTIPVSLIGTFAVMMAAGLSINTLTLFGLVLAIGVVVDDAIVVVENTMRLIDDEKLEPKEATAKAMEEITGPVVATTLVLLAVFVPTAMMGGITGRLYKQFAITISVATVFSSVNALTLSPALCGLLLRPSPEKRIFFFRAFNWAFDHTTSGYRWVVSFMVRHAFVIMILFAAAIFGLVQGFKSVPTGFIPFEDQGVMLASVMLPDGAAFERTEEVLDQVDKILEKTPGIRNYITIAGFSLFDAMSMTNAGAYFISLEPWDERTDPSLKDTAIVQSLQAQFNKIQEAICFVVIPPPIPGLGVSGGFQYQLQDVGGAGLMQLQQIAEDIAVAGTANPILTRMNSTFRASVPQMFLDIDRTKAKTLGISLNTVFNTLAAFFGSAYVNDFNLFGRTFKVMLQGDHQYRNTVEDIGRLEVRDRKGNMVPLSTLLTARETAGPKIVSRYNLYPTAFITGEPRPGYSSGQAIAAMQEISAAALPPSMDYEWTGVTYQEIKAGATAGFIFVFAIVFVYLFLAAQYESWAIPWAVILSVPLALLGGIFATMLRAFDNNVYTQIGFVLLIGLASKSAILIVEFAKAQRESGKSIREAAVEAARLRFRAILMTAFSFILGVAPLVIASGAGAASRRALGTAVFGGMLVGTITGVFFIPTLYTVVQTLSEKLRRSKV